MKLSAILLIATGVVAQTDYGTANGTANYDVYNYDGDYEYTIDEFGRRKRGKKKAEREAAKAAKDAAKQAAKDAEENNYSGGDGGNGGNPYAGPTKPTTTSTTTTTTTSTTSTTTTTTSTTTSTTTTTSTRSSTSHILAIWDWVSPSNAMLTDSDGETTSIRWSNEAEARASSRCSLTFQNQFYILG